MSLHLVQVVDNLINVGGDEAQVVAYDDPSNFILRFIRWS